MFEDNSFYAEIESTRLAFEKLAYKKPLTDTIERVNVLLQENESAWSNLSGGYRSMRKRAHSLAIDIRKELGPEVLLCVILVAKSVSNMAKLRNNGNLMDRLKQWWTTASHPSSLTKAASALIVGHHPTKISVCEEPPVEAATVGQHATTIKQDAADTLEKALKFAAQNIPNLQDREDWLTSAAAHTRLLRLLSRSEDNP